jgi:DNA mismatch repair ATPase MutS
VVIRDYSRKLKIIDGRHPTVEESVAVKNGFFAPHSLCLSYPDSFLHLITAPNASGKSTSLRLTALITILAQVGSFVPAASAEIGLVDKIFTRIGARDEVSRGRSTFMIEMEESSEILRRATERSLVSSFCSISDKSKRRRDMNDSSCARSYSMKLGEGPLQWME